MNKDNNKPILAIETSSDICSAAIFYEETKYSEINLKLKNIHSEKLVEIVRQLLDINHVELANLKYLAISSGPGSFTGLRIGMAAAKGLAFGAQLPMISVPTFEALALQIKEYIPQGKEFIIATRVNIDEVYYAKYLLSSDKIISVDELQVINKDQLVLKISKDELIYGNVMLEKAQIDIRPISSPNALYVAKWAYLFGKDLLNYNFDFLEPNYLKNFVVKTKGE